jgi:hypothetical protein
MIPMMGEECEAEAGKFSDQNQVMVPHVMVVGVVSSADQHHPLSAPSHCEQVTVFPTPLCASMILCSPALP